MSRDLAAVTALGMVAGLSLGAAIAADTGLGPDWGIALMLGGAVLGASMASIIARWRAVAVRRGNAAWRARRAHRRPF